MNGPTDPSWTVIVPPRVERAIARLPRPEREHLLQAIQRLTRGPSGRHVKHLAGRPEWRLQVASNSCSTARRANYHSGCCCGPREPPGLGEPSPGAGDDSGAAPGAERHPGAGRGHGPPGRFRPAPRHRPPWRWDAPSAPKMHHLDAPSGAAPWPRRRKPLSSLAGETGLEPATPGFGVPRAA